MSTQVKNIDQKLESGVRMRRGIEIDLSARKKTTMFAERNNLLRILEGTAVGPFAPQSNSMPGE